MSITRTPKTGGKVMTLHDAVQNLIPDGAHIRFGGHGSGRPIGIVNEIIRQGIKHLSISGMGMFQELDILVGAGAVDRFECSWYGLEASLSPCIRRAAEKEIPHKVEMREYSHLSMTMRFMAGALGLPFMTVKSLKGSSLLEEGLKKGDIKEIDCPFTGERLVAVSAINPDVAVIHAQRADRFGNVQIWGYTGDDNWGTYSAGKVIVTVEEIVDSKQIKSDPNRVMIPGFMVDAVVEMPFGAHPWGVTGYYRNDQEFLAGYIKAARHLESFNEFIDTWVLGCGDMRQYLDKLGAGRLDQLRPKQALSTPVNYG